VTITVLAWLAGLLVLVLVIATAVALVRLLVPKLMLGSGRALKVTVVVFALLGAIAVGSSATMGVMHLSMSMMECCEQQ